MVFSIITLFPEVFTHVFDVSIARKAKNAQKMEVNLVNLREFGIGKHRVVDDKPYGGGVGMVLRVDVLDKALQSVKRNISGEVVALLDPKGEQYSQKKAEELSKLEHLILICGHYEGFDERIRNLVDSEISIGDYVLSGGEIPAMVVVESVMRLLPGVLKNEEAHELESFSKIENKRILEYPQYTRPEEYNGQKVPDILLSGNQKRIEEYRIEEALKLTKKRRPDLLT